MRVSVIYPADVHVLHGADMTVPSTVVSTADRVDANLVALLEVWSPHDAYFACSRINA